MSRNIKGEFIVMVVSKDNIVEVCVLKIDCIVGLNWLVIDGLNNGDKLIVEGL